MAPPPPFNLASLLVSRLEERGVGKFKIYNLFAHDVNPYVAPLHHSPHTSFILALLNQLFLSKLLGNTW